MAADGPDATEARQAGRATRRKSLVREPGEGKRRMTQVGRVEVPRGAFLTVPRT